MDKMNKTDIIAQLKSKYKEVFSKCWSIYIKKIEEPTNQEIIKIYNYLNSNVKYIEKYISILTMQDEAIIEHEIEKNNFIKELNDALYEPTKKNNYTNNSKIQENI